MLYGHGCLFFLGLRRPCGLEEGRGRARKCEEIGGKGNFLIVPPFEHRRKMACSTTCIQIHNITPELHVTAEGFPNGAVKFTLRDTLPSGLRGTAEGKTPPSQLYQPITILAVKQKEQKSRDSPILEVGQVRRQHIFGVLRNTRHDFQSSDLERPFRKDLFPILLSS